MPSNQNIRENCNSCRGLKNGLVPESILSKAPDVATSHGRGNAPMHPQGGKAARRRGNKAAKRPNGKATRRRKAARRNAPRPRSEGRSPTA